jgi:ribonuclease Z
MRRVRAKEISLWEWEGWMFRSLWFRIAAGFAFLLAMGGLLLFLPAGQDWLLVQGIRHQVSRESAFGVASNELKVLLCGTSSPAPNLLRAKTCTVVIAGKHTFVVDVGPGSANKLSFWRFPFERIDAILLTHFHSDHIGDIGEFHMLSWMAGRSLPLPVYGPSGVEDIVAGANLLYAADDRYRSIKHHLNPDAVKLDARPFGLADPNQRSTHMASAVIYGADGLRITAFQVIHEPVYPAVGYRFDYRGRSAVISGDTAMSPNLVRVARGADLLIHEGQSEVEQKLLAAALSRSGDVRLARVLSEVVNYHTTPEQAAREANEAGVRMLVFNHVGPIAPDNILTRRIFARGVSSIRPSTRWMLGYDGLLLNLRQGATIIQTGWVP